MSLAIETISNVYKGDSDSKSREFNILEFGSGDGFQIPYLQQIGKVVASDIYVSNDLKNMKNVDFVVCSILHTPFGEGQFDLVFSNHVIEHIEDMCSAFEELKRIGKPDCLYSFSVPTNIWLLLSIPAHYHKVVRNIRRKLLSIFYSKTHKSTEGNIADNSRNGRGAKSVADKLYRIICPPGHGVYASLFDCYRVFTIRKWRQLFSDNSFFVVKVQPLLLYAASEWPIIPTTKPLGKAKICSSVLFLLSKMLKDDNILSA